MLFLLTAGALLLTAVPARAQVPYDASWYSADQPYAKIEVAEDDLYRVSGSDLSAAGVPLGQIDPATLRLLKKGDEIPIRVSGGGDGAFSSGDAFVFAGRRNDGQDEEWAYKNYDLSLQSSAYHSLYTDTLTYWLTWGGEAGRRYTSADPSGGGSTVTALRDTLHREEEHTFYYAEPGETGDPRYTEDEGYYWRDLDANNSDSFQETLSLDRLATAAADLNLSVRVVSRTGNCHRAALEIDTGSGFTQVDEREWEGYTARTFSTQIPQSQISGGDLGVRVQSYNDGYSDLNGCDPTDPNNLLVDFVEAAYTRVLAPAADGQQRFTAPSAQPATFELSGYGSGSSVRVFSPATGRRFSISASGSTARFSDDSAPGEQYWVATPGSFRAPVALTYQPPGSRPDWTASGNDADYLLLTTEALRPSAEQLASYRESHDGYDVAVVELDQVYDQFDYGRATPIAIRRLVHYSQSQWAGAPEFFTIWGDATYPVYTDTQVRDAPWNVPSFGFSPSDGWYAMQYDGPEDWSEVVAVGRVPLRTAAQAGLFLTKLQNYESSSLKDWQKRMLLLSGGTSASQQNRLENATIDWGQVAGNPPTGMDTIYFAKQSDDALDESFQDSLSAAFERGAGWLNYFGHSAAQSWEIVTDAPSEFDNADRLPFVVSLGCQTGAFAGGRSESKPAPAFGEQLVVGSLDGSIGHYGTSYLGNIGVSEDLNDPLINRVFEDTVRVIGRAIQQAEAGVAADNPGSTKIEHLMQYGLLGDPATHLQIPDRPNLHLEPSQIAVEPLAPIPSDSLHVTVRLKNQGLVPADSVRLRFTRTEPDGDETAETRLVDPFPLTREITFSQLLVEENVGANRFRAEADPANEIAEEREDDNAAVQTQVVFVNGARLVNPRDLHIAPRPSPTFRLSLMTDESQPPPVRLQLAPTPAFDNLLAQATKTGSGPLVKWEPSLNLDEEQTYYWRARLEDPGEDPSDWDTASFTARPALSDGWLQQDEQFARNTSEERLGRTDDGQWTFKDFNVQVQASSERGSGSLKGAFVLNGSQRYEVQGRGFGVLVMDGATAEVKAHGSFCTYETSDFTEMNCTGQVDGPAAVDLLETFIDDNVDEGDYVFTRTRHLSRNTTEIPDAVEEIFRHLGDDDGPVYSQAIDTLTYDDLWAMQARKGSPGETDERVEPAGSGENEIIYASTLSFTYPGGQTTAPRIGPAKSWDDLNWRQTLDGTGDRLRVDVLSGDGQDVLVEDLAAGDLPRDLSGISTLEHPYLRLRATLTDSTDYTAPQLQQWRLTYTPTTELALDPARLTFSADTLDEDQRAEASVPVVNLVERPSEPVRVHFTVTDSSNQTRTVGVDSIGAIGAEGEAVAQAQFTASDLAGDAVLNARAEQVRSGESVPEPLSFNNSIVKSFFVRGDDTAPDVRVLVGGRELPYEPDPVNNLQNPALPYVPLEPTIEIILDDNNEYRTFSDTSLVDISLDDDPVSFASSKLEFKAADAAGEPARAIFTPDFTGQDTIHTLTVEVEDVNGNIPDQDFQTHFRVRTEMRVQDLYPYPNPMNTHTTFAFRLEGGSPSDIEKLRLRIYTLGGRLVRQFTRTGADFDHIDWNKIRWDGRDADGDRLATGVYLYKVLLEGEGDLDVNDGNVEKVTIIR